MNKSPLIIMQPDLGRYGKLKKNIRIHFKCMIHCHKLTQTLRFVIFEHNQILINIIKKISLLFFMARSHTFQAIEIFFHYKSLKSSEIKHIHFAKIKVAPEPD